MINTFVYLDLILEKLNFLSKLFQNEKVTLTSAILATRGAIMEFSELVCEETRIETYTALRVSTLIDSLKATDMEVLDPIGRRTDRVDWKTKLNEQLNEYTKELVAELSRRFGSDTEMIIGLVIFNHKDWINMIKYLKLQGIDSRILEDEARNISRHITLSPQIDTTSSFKFWQSFLRDEYTRKMFPEHSHVSTLMLVLPLGSCAVERCFSYSTRICSDSRSALTLSHVGDLVRISQQGPEFPKVSEIQWPFILPNNPLDEYIEEVFNLWRMSARRL